MVGKIPTIVDYICGLIERNKSTDPKYVWANLVRQFPELTDKTKCANCGMSMKIQVYTADLHDALLILAMAKVVKENLSKGMGFTEANKVYMPTLGVTNATLKRQTKCDYLDLVKQPEELRNTGYWVLTAWAWKALRGEAIPKQAIYWRGQLKGRSEETTTLAQMFQTHKDLVERAIARRKQVRSDYRNEFVDYKPSEWVEVSGLQQGSLL